VRFLGGRGVRLELVAGLGIALAMPALAVTAQHVRGLATQTTLAAETHDQAGRTRAAVTVAVAGVDGLPATGTVAIRDNGRDVAGAVLNAQGQANLLLDLPGGDHQLRAVYNGDATHQASVSSLTGLHALVSTGTPDFQISIAPATLSLTAGQSSTIIATITPVNADALQAQGPMFVTLSCSGNPDQSYCIFTPENVEILPNAVSSVTSSMVFQTQAATQSTAFRTPATPRHASPIAWAFLLPGVLCLAGTSWKTHRRWLSRLSLMTLVGLVTMLGATGCNPLYYYQHHGPLPSPATPPGTYVVKISAQSTNGITAITHSTTLALTVQ